MFNQVPPHFSKSSCVGSLLETLPSPLLPASLHSLDPPEEGEILAPYKGPGPILGGLYLSDNLTPGRSPLPFLLLNRLAMEQRPG